MKIINIIKNIVLDIIIVTLVAFIIISFLNKKKPIPFFKYYFFTIMSGSMNPELNVGDSIIVKKSIDYKVGDIITYKKDNIYVTHRITSIEENIITTKGDANMQSDPPIDKSDVLGKAVVHNKILTFIVKNKVIIIILVIILYLIDMGLKSGKREVEKDDTEVLG